MKPKKDIWHFWTGCENSPVPKGTIGQVLINDSKNPTDPLLTDNFDWTQVVAFKVHKYPEEKVNVFGFELPKPMTTHPEHKNRYYFLDDTFHVNDAFYYGFKDYDRFQNAIWDNKEDAQEWSKFIKDMIAGKYSTKTKTVTVLIRDLKYKDVFILNNIHYVVDEWNVIKSKLRARNLYDNSYSYFASCGYAVEKYVDTE